MDTARCDIESDLLNLSFYPELVMTRSLTFILLSFLCVGHTWSASTAYAQDSTDDAIVGSTIVAIISTYTLPSTSGLGTTAGVVWALTSAAANKQVDRYLALNQTKVEQAFAMGSGDAVKDLGHMFGITSARQGAFGALLREQRAALKPLATGKRNTPALVRALKAHILAHPELRDDARPWTKG